MIEIKMTLSLQMPIERLARLIIQDWQELRHFHTDPDVRMVAQIGDEDRGVVVYDGTADLASLMQDIERQTAWLHLLEDAESHRISFALIKELHRLAQAFGDVLTLEVAGHTIEAHPEDDPLTLWQAYRSQREGEQHNRED